MRLELHKVSKSFAGQTVLHNVDLAITYGEVHALLGQNGSGKSTLIKVLSGYHEADPGGFAELDGRRLVLGSPELRDEAGLRFVHQDLGLVLSLSVLDNVMLGKEFPHDRIGRIRWGETEELVRTYLRQLGIDVDPGVLVGELSLAERAGVAIARAVADVREQRMLIVLDEPTAALPPGEVRRLMQIIDRLRQEGHAVLLVTHHLGEVLAIADRATVLRDGWVAGSADRAELDHDRLATLIVGQSLTSTYVAPAGDPRPRAEGQLVLEARGIAGGRVVGVDLEVQRGEILGVAGITGSGRESLAPLLTGQIARRGQVRINGALVPANSPREAMAMGLAQVAGERGRYGLFPNLSLRANMTISDLDSHIRFLRVRRSSERDEAAEWVRRLGIVARGTEAPITTLSGGNQQKAMIARALRLNPCLLVLDDPTTGIDIGARLQVHDIVEACSADGMGIVLISTDSDELARLADRVLIMRAGRVSDEVIRGPGLTADAIDMSLTRIDGSLGSEKGAP